MSGACLFCILSSTAVASVAVLSAAAKILTATAVAVRIIAPFGSRSVRLDVMGGRYYSILRSFASRTALLLFVRLYFYVFSFCSSLFCDLFSVISCGNGDFLLPFHPRSCCPAFRRWRLASTFCAVFWVSKPRRVASRQRCRSCRDRKSLW